MKMNHQTPMPIAFILVFLTQALWNLSAVSAQTFLNNHQQFMHSVDWESIIAQAIDNADDDNYVIAGTIKPSFVNNEQLPILAKLGPNTPEANPFDIQWAMTYTPSGSDDILDYNVRDVIQTLQNEYLIAGQVRRFDGDVYSNFEAFLLRTDSIGNPILLKQYQQIEILNSVVANPHGESFAAVGVSVDGQAAILSVNVEELDLLCAKEIRGDFEDPAYPSTSGSLNKVIVYSDYYISVGESTGYEPSLKFQRDTNVLFTSFDPQCNIITKSYYGLPTEIDADGTIIQNTEIGNSLTFYAQYVLITGSVTRCNPNNVDGCEYEDILYMGISLSGAFLGGSRYEIQDNVDDYRKKSRGMAISFRQQGKRVLIAGETITSDILPPSGSTLSKDIFLLELKLNGNPIQLELFGASNTDEFNVDLTLSPDKHAVMLSNTPLNPICDDFTGPWLIERYKNINERCRDAPYDPTKRDYPLHPRPALEKEIDAPGNKVGLVGKVVEMNQWIMCPKLRV